MLQTKKGKVNKNMIYLDGTDETVEKHKKKLGITGDVYIVNHFINSLESHKKFFTDSTATTIEEAQTEMENYLLEEEEKQKAAMEEAQAQAEEEAKAQSEEEVTDEDTTNDEVA